MADNANNLELTNATTALSSTSSSSFKTNMMGHKIDLAMRDEDDVE